MSQQHPVLMKKGYQLLLVFSAYLKLKGDSDDACEGSDHPALFCYNIKKRKLIWQIPQAIAIISLTEQGIARVAISRGDYISGIDTMKWTEDDDGHVEIKAAANRTYVALRTMDSSALSVYEHDDRVTCILHGLSAKTYDLKTGEQIYNIRGSVHYFTRDSRSFIQQLVTFDKSDKATVICYDISADTGNDRN